MLRQCKYHNVHKGHRITNKNEYDKTMFLPYAGLFTWKEIIRAELIFPVQHDFFCSI